MEKSTADNSFFLKAISSPATDTMEKDRSEYSTSQEFTEEDPDLEALENEITLENLRKSTYSSKPSGDCTSASYCCPK